MTGMADKKFAIVVSALDCTGCGSCANVCPGKKGAKALDMAEHGSKCSMPEALRLRCNSSGESRRYRKIQRGYRKRISVQDSAA